MGVRRWCLASVSLLSLLAVGCGATATPSTSSASTPSSTPTLLGPRTVLSSLGVNIRATAAPNATVLQTAAQGAQFNALQYTTQNGGWFQVEGSTVVGWISADPALTAAGVFTRYSSDSHFFSVLYPQLWTFAEAANAVIFRPQSGQDTITVRAVSTTHDLQLSSNDGYVQSSVEENVVVCGVTTRLALWKSSKPVATATPTLSTSPTASPTSPTTSATPTATAQPLLAYRAQLVLEIDATHLIGIEYNYADVAGLQTLRNFYNSMTFPFPQCQK